MAGGIFAGPEYRKDDTKDKVPPAAASLDWRDGADWRKASYSAPVLRASDADPRGNPAKGGRKCRYTLLPGERITVYAIESQQRKWISRPCDMIAAVLNHLVLP